MRDRDLVEGSDYTIGEVLNLAPAATSFGGGDAPDVPRPPVYCRRKWLRLAAMGLAVGPMPPSLRPVPPAPSPT